MFPDAARHRGFLSVFISFAFLGATLFLIDVDGRAAGEGDGVGGIEGGHVADLPDIVVGGLFLEPKFQDITDAETWATAPSKKKPLT